MSQLAPRCLAFTAAVALLPFLFACGGGDGGTGGHHGGAGGHGTTGSGGHGTTGSGGTSTGSGGHGGGAVSTCTPGMVETCANCVFSKSFGGVDAEIAGAVAVDGMGNILLGGAFQQSADFGGGVLTSAGLFDAFVVKLDPKGAHLWSKRYGAASSDTVGDIAADGAGNVIVTGAFSGTTSFGGAMLTAQGSFGCFFLKLDAAGNHVWSKAVSTTDGSPAAGCDASAVAVDGAGNVIVSGKFTGTVDFGGGPMSYAGIGGYEQFVVKLDAAGNHVWSKALGEVQSAYPSVAADGAGNVVVTGNFVDPVDFGGGTLPPAGFNDVVVLALDPAGNHRWSKRFGDAQDQTVQRVRLDGAGNVILAGAFDGTIDFGTGPIASSGQRDVFVAKLDPSGNGVWSRQFGGPSADFALSLATRGTTDIVVAGFFRETAAFGGTSLVSLGESDAFAAKLDGSGQVVWAKGYGSATDEQANAVALDATGHTIVAGLLSTSIDLGCGPLVSSNPADVFVAKLSP